MDGNRHRANNVNHPFQPGTIIRGDTGKSVTFDQMIADLETVRIVYVGEIHTDASHHAIQLRILKALARKVPNLKVGLEMVDQTYQPILDQWTSGNLDPQTFLRKSHWYANWRFDFDLYADIFQFIQTRHIPLVGLNIPFHIPAKIAVGGIENLSDVDRNYLPHTIDLTQADHRKYVKKIYKFHKIKGRDRFEDFYATQCVWEEAMAEAISRHLGSENMVVFVGNGHIIYKFGIPDRTFARTHASFRTICLLPAHSDIKPTAADYIWITQTTEKHRFIQD